VKNNAYQFDRKITFVKIVDLLNEINETVLVMQDYVTTYASISPYKPLTTKSQEFLEDQKAKPEVLYKIVLNYMPTSPISPNMLIRYGSRIYQIIGIMNIGEGNKIVELDCLEKVIT
jgi:head-tail adaptor